MQVYLVGGAVRDALMGLTVHERDWVVVGATVEMLLQQGYRPVGRDFPVFLHPETQEEYALARTERKVGRGYKGFTFYAEADVSLEQDLQRRDLTVNAIAQDAQGQFIDPYGGIADIKAKCLRHVSSAFAEDPVRILRLARFAARFPDFSVHPDTINLAKNMVANGEVDALVAERVYKECARALMTRAPARFFLILQQVDAFKILFPGWQLDASSLDMLAQMPNEFALPERWAFLSAKQSVHAVQDITQRYRLPQDVKQLSLLVVQQHAKYALLPKLDAQKLLDLLRACDAMRRPQRAQEFLNVCAFIYPTLNNKSIQDIWSSCVIAIKNIDMQHALQSKSALTSKEIKAAVLHAQLNVVRRVLADIS